MSDWLQKKSIFHHFTLQKSQVFIWTSAGFPSLKWQSPQIIHFLSFHFRSFLYEPSILGNHHDTMTMETPIKINNWWALRDYKPTWSSSDSASFQETLTVLSFCPSFLAESSPTCGFPHPVFPQVPWCFPIISTKKNMDFPPLLDGWETPQV